MCWNVEKNIYKVYTKIQIQTPLCRLIALN
jgi:hypothetical protein